jgi:hypothetical protein
MLTRDRDRGHWASEVVKERDAAEKEREKWVPLPHWGERNRFSKLFAPITDAFATVWTKLEVDAIVMVMNEWQGTGQVCGLRNNHVRTYIYDPPLGVNSSKRKGKRDGKPRYRSWAIVHVADLIQQKGSELLAALARAEAEVAEQTAAAKLEVPVAAAAASTSALDGEQREKRILPSRPLFLPGKLRGSISSSLENSLPYQQSNGGECSTAAGDFAAKMEEAAGKRAERQPAQEATEQLVIEAQQDADELADPNAPTIGRVVHQTKVANEQLRVLSGQPPSEERFQREREWHDYITQLKALHDRLVLKAQQSAPPPQQPQQLREEERDEAAVREACVAVEERMIRLSVAEAEAWREQLKSQAEAAMSSWRETTSDPNARPPLRVRIMLAQSSAAAVSPEEAAERAAAQAAERAAALAAERAAAQAAERAARIGVTCTLFRSGKCHKGRHCKWSHGTTKRERDESEALPDPKQQARSTPCPMRVDELGPIYQAKSLLASRQAASGGREFLVRWAGFDSTQDTWEPDENIIDRLLVSKFDQTRPKGARASRGRRPHRTSQPTESQPKGLWRATDIDNLVRERLGPDHQALIPEWPLVPQLNEPQRSEPQLLQLSGDGRSAVAAEGGRDVAAMLTAAAYGPLEDFAFVSPCDSNLGLFARETLKAGQFITEYAGPRLPLRLQVLGEYVLQVPGTNFVVDGAGENSPKFEHRRAAALYANHSSSPNARLESWPVLRAGALEVQQRMMLVAMEPIEAGREIRIDYELGPEATYWTALGCSPAESDWRAARVQPPPPSGEEPVYDRLQELQAAAESGRQPPACQVPRLCTPVPWEGPSGGDARLHAIVPLLSTNGRDANQSAWPLVSTHVPGRSGRECKQRWEIIQDLDTHAGWLQTSADRAVSHTEAAEAIAQANREAALAAAERGEASSDEEADCFEGYRSARCCISGCKRQLLSCFGRKHSGSAVGCAEESHFLCAPCLFRWFASETALREESGMQHHSRRTCPVCKSELRASASDVRTDGANYIMGLRKVESTW